MDANLTDDRLDGLAETSAPEPATTTFDRIFKVMTLVAVPTAMLVMAVRQFIPISDPDTFWHLRLGEYLLDDWQFTGPEPWTSLATRPLVFHEWTPEVLYALTFRAGGWPALSWLQALGAVALIVVMYLCSRQFAGPLVSAFTGLGGFVAASGAIALRPQVVSLVLIPVVTVAWLRTADDHRPRWWLVPLTWVWACTHGMWLMSVAIGGAIVLGMWLDGRAAPRQTLKLAAVPALSLISAALTPVGPQLLTTASAMRAYAAHVSEWAAPSLFDPQTILALGLASVILVVWLRRAARTQWTELGLWALAVLCCLSYTRTIAVGAAILSVLAARVLGQAIRTTPSRTPPAHLERRVLVGAVIVALLLPLGLHRAVDEPAGVPAALSSSLNRLPAGTVVFNQYRLGGWLLWAHPKLDPVIDGRADVYDIRYFERVVASYQVPPGWQSVVAETRASAALLPESSSLAEALQESLGWREVARDRGVVLLVPEGSPVIP